MLEQFEESILALNNAIEYNDKMVAAYRNLADVYDRLARSHFMQKEYNLALENLEKAMALVPKDSPVYKYLQERKAMVVRAIEESKR